MTTCRCACGSMVTLTGPMETWDGPMLAHVRSPRHRAWSALQTEDATTPHIYEEHIDSLVAASTSETRGTAVVRTSVSTTTPRVRKVA